jgi:hypothetical protein
MTPTFTIALGNIIDGTRGTPVLLNFTKTGLVLTLPSDQEGGDDPASLKANKKL